MLKFISPSLNLHKQFTMQTSLQEFGMNMITINRTTGKYEEYTGVV